MKRTYIIIISIACLLSLINIGLNLHLSKKIESLSESLSYTQNKIEEDKKLAKVPEVMSFRKIDGKYVHIENLGEEDTPKTTDDLNKYLDAHKDVYRIIVSGREYIVDTKLYYDRIIDPSFSSRPTGVISDDDMPSE